MNYKKIARTTSTFAWFSVGTASAAASSVKPETTLDVISNPYTAAGSIVISAVVSTVEIEGLVPTDTNGDVYYMVGDTPVKDATASAATTGRSVQVTVKLKADLTSTTQITTLGQAYQSMGTADLAKQFYVDVSASGTHIKISKTEFANGTAVSSSDNKKTLAQMGLSASTTGTSFTMTDPVLTFYVGINGGTDQANTGYGNNDSDTGYKLVTEVKA